MKIKTSLLDENLPNQSAFKTPNIVIDFIYLEQWGKHIYFWYYF